MPKATEPDGEPDIARLSVLVACASVLQVAEALLPYPLPGVRLGLANMVTLIALVEISPGNAFRLALLRSLISSLILGTFLTPSFVLSFSGAMVSAAIMVLFYRLSRVVPWLRFSLVGISVAGSVSHVLAQLIVVYLLFVRNQGVLLLWPWLALSGVVMGAITGVVAIEVCKRLDTRAPGVAPAPGPVRVLAPQGHYVRRDSPVHRLGPEVKLVAVVLLALAVVILRSVVLYAAVLAALGFITILARVRFSALFYNLRRLATFIAFTFFLPLVFTPAGEVLFRFGPLVFTVQGLTTGGILTLRIVVLFFATSLLALTTSPEQVASGLERLLAPLKLVGVSSRPLARVLALSWSFFPVLWQRAQQMVRNGTGRKRGWATVVSFLPDLVTELYLEAEQMTARDS